MSLLKQELTAITRLFSATQSRYAVIGGLAVYLYGEPRMTLDIDVIVLIEKYKIDSFLKVAKKHGFSPAVKNIKPVIKKMGVAPMQFFKNTGGIRCDIIIAENVIEFLALERARTRKIAGVKIRVITPEDLIIHKIISTRPKDLEDLSSIIARQKGGLDVRYIKYWVGKVAKNTGTPGITNLLRSLLKKNGGNDD